MFSYIFEGKKEGTIKLKVLIGFLNTNHIIHSCYVDNFSNLYSPVIQSMLCNALVIDIKTLSEKCESIQQLPSKWKTPVQCTQFMSNIQKQYATA